MKLEQIITGEIGQQFVYQPQPFHIGLVVATTPDGDDQLVRAWLVLSNGLVRRLQGSGDRR